MEEAYSEDEAETHFENRGEELDSSPHHFEVIGGHEIGLAGEIGSFGVQLVAVRVRGHAALVRFCVQTYYH